MPDVSPVLALPLIQPAQAQKHVTHNEALRLLDVLVQPVVARRDLAAPPADPVEGDRQIVAAAPTGAWAGQAQKIALFEAGTWVFLPPQPGWTVRVLAEDIAVVFDGAGWIAPADTLIRLAAVGINADADATNRLTVAGPATLLTHDGAGHQVKLNKAQSSDTASLLFQTGFSGRAEVGLTGNDDLTMKVSADGSAWAEALRIGAATGEARLFQPMRIADGAAAGPGLRFNADGDTGLFRPGPDQVALTAGGAARLTAAATGVEAAVPLRGPAGSAALPGLGFTEDTDTGLMQAAANQIGLVTGGVVRATLSNAGLQIDVPLSGTATTQGPTDAGDNRVPRMRTSGGIFGLGGLDAPSAPDVDDHTLRSGIWRTHAATAAGTLPPGFTLGSFGGSGPLLVLRHDGGSLTQWWSSLSDAQIWTRRYSGSWTAWQRATRILGSVSQVGGAATGAILERGSNANGQFLRLADGTLICTRVDLSAANAATALGALFRSGDVGWTFPATFSTAPLVTGTVDDLDAWLTTGAAGTTAVSLRAVSAVSKAGALTLRATAIGRWFN